MKRVELRLIPAPGQKPEFLASLEPVNQNPPPPIWEQTLQLHPIIVLEGYTRDAWALDTACKWQKLQVQSVDGRNKLAGFVKYLRERQKTCFGRFGEYVLVVSHKQMSSSTLACRVASLSQIPQCPLKPIQKQTAPKPQPAPVQKPPPTKSASSAAPSKNNNSMSKPKKKGFGLLGNLVGAQRRTNQQVETASTAKKPQATTSSDSPAASGDGGTSLSDDLKTSGQVLAEFRQEMEQKMLDFDISAAPTLEVKVDLAAKLRLLSESEKQMGRVTMEVLKYIVYEQAEELNEEWIAHKEPSEFMDETTIIIYKEGEAPPEVMEDMNKGELPDEVRGQQRAMQEAQRKMQEQKASKSMAEKQRAAMRSNDDDFAALNTQKRDRRTIEDYERDNIKRHRGGE